jgi:hypothetical protein
VKIVADNANKGNFIAEKGNIDKRELELKDIILSEGFQIECGIKGSKLSGG